VIGVTMVVLGLSYFTVSLLVDWDSLGHWGSVYVAGACLTGVGAAAMAVGLPIWIVGRVRERRLDQQLEGQQSRGRPSVLVAPLFAYSPPERAAVGGVTLIF